MQKDPLKPAPSFNTNCVGEGKQKGDSPLTESDCAEKRLWKFSVKFQVRSSVKLMEFLTGDPGGTFQGVILPRVGPPRLQRLFIPIALPDAL